MNFEQNGIRFNWNVFPGTRLECSQLSVPLGCLYTPFSATQKPKALETTSLASCRTCGAYMNPYVDKNESMKLWTCPFCCKRSHFPLEDQKIPNDEFIETSLAQDITSGFDGGIPDCYVFIVDKYKHIDDLQNKDGKGSVDSLIQQILNAIDIIPDGSLIALITVDEAAHFHQIQNDKIVSFTTQEFFDAEIFKLEQMIKHASSMEQKIIQKLNINGNLDSSFTQSRIYNEANIITIVDEKTRYSVKEYLKNIQFTSTDSFKPKRALGLSLYIASLVFGKFSFQCFRGEFFVFSSGPNTTSPGIILSDGDQLRSHFDIKQLNPNSKYIETSKFYNFLSYIANGVSHSSAFQLASNINKKTTEFELSIKSPKWTYHIFVGSLDQVGLYELKNLASNTNGSILISSSFNEIQFQAQFCNILKSIQTAKSNATLTVHTSPQLKISKMIGHSYKLPSSYVDDQQYHTKISDQLTIFDSKLKKNYFTNRWCWNQLYTEESLALFFDIEGARSSSDVRHEFMYIQFVLKYWDKKNKTWNLRINTIRKPTTLRSRNNQQLENLKLNLNNAKIDMLKNLDAECWVTLFSRIIIDRLDTNLGFDFEATTKLIDSTLISLLNNFAKEIVNGDQLNENLNKIPKLIYKFKRNQQLIQIFNASPDETAYYHHWFMKFNNKLSILAIQPSAYSIIDQKDIESIELEADVIENLGDHAIVVVDTVFSVIIYNHFKKDCYKLDLHPSENESMIQTKEMEYILNFIESSLHIGKRCLYPKFIISQTNHSQARFLFAKLSPKRTDSKASEIKVNKEKKKSWISSLFKSSSSSSSSFQNNYDIYKTDEISYDCYYESLIGQIKNHKLH